MQVIKKNIKTTQDEQKSYAYQHMVFKEFQIGEHVYFPSIPRRAA